MAPSIREAADRMRAALDELNAARDESALLLAGSPREAAIQRRIRLARREQDLAARALLAAVEAARAPVTLTPEADRAWWHGWENGYNEAMARIGAVPRGLAAINAAFERLADASHLLGFVAGTAGYARTATVYLSRAVPDAPPFPRPRWMLDDKGGADTATGAVLEAVGRISNA